MTGVLGQGHSIISESTAGKKVVARTAGWAPDGSRMGQILSEAKEEQEHIALGRDTRNRQLARVTRAQFSKIR